MLGWLGPVICQENQRYLGLLTGQNSTPETTGGGEQSTRFHLLRTAVFWQSWLKLQNWLKALGAPSPLLTNRRSMMRKVLTS